MSSQYETGKEKIISLSSWYQEHSSNRNEATTRLHIIDTLLFECLYWDKRADCVVEERRNKKYSDYTLMCPRRTVIVEAKKEGHYFEIPSGYSNRRYRISTLIKDVKKLGTAILQASDYCQKRGAPFGVVTNGHQLVAFIGSRQDGLAPDEGEAFVFESFEAMCQDFRLLWDLLSKPGVISRNLQKHLLESDQSILPRKLSETISHFPGIKNRNVLQTDLQILADFVIEDIVAAQQLEDEFLEYCYCKSGALSQYALISKKLLSKRYEALFADENQQPTLVPATGKKGIAKDLIAESFSRRPILLLGDVGVGKTIFFRHFIRIDAKEIFENALALYLDFGSKAAFAKDIREFALEEIERQLLIDHNVDISENSFVRGVYHGELIRFSYGIYGPLKDSKPAQYQEKEIAFLEEKLKNCEQHCIESIKHLTKARKKQVILFLDNADQRSDSVQQQLFIIAQGMASQWPVTVFLALRPETFHRSKKKGSMSAYHLKAFTIAPPRADLVLKKRLSFGLEITRGNLPSSVLPSGVHVDLEKVGIFLTIVKDTLDKSDDLLEAIDNLSGGNIRVALDFIKRLVSSGHIDTRKILDIYNKSGSYIVGLHEFLRSIIYGDTAYYDPNTSPVFNLFDLMSPDHKEHFLCLIILQRIDSEGKRSRSHGFVEIGILYDFLQGLGFTVPQIDHSICNLIAAKLLETAGRLQPVEGDVGDSAVRITTIGAYHLYRLPCIFVYYDAIATDLTILDESVRSVVTEVPDISDRLERGTIILAYLDSCNTDVPDKISGLEWKTMKKTTEDNINEIKRKIGL